MNPAITNGFCLFTFFAIFLPDDRLAAVVRSGSTANGILRMLGDESRSVVRRRGGGGTEA